MLTDEQCMAFRRMPGSFNDMVRAIYAAGGDTLRERVKELESKLARYEQGIEVEGKVSQNSCMFGMPREIAGQRVRVIVLKGE